MMVCNENALLDLKIELNDMVWVLKQDCQQTFALRNGHGSSYTPF